jgi:asparagine N-glycosylation enzyme membrane subunit Stt3
VVAFAFGLLHGLGFAGALSEIGLPPSEIPLVLLFFNIGVEIGQLMFVASVLVLAWVINRVRIDGEMWTRVVPAYVIGTLATFWFLQRLAVIFVAV